MQWQSLELFIGQSTGALAFVFPDAVINFHSKACSTRSAPSSSPSLVCLPLRSTIGNQTLCGATVAS